MGGDGLPDLRGAVVAFGNTRPRARELVLGLRERGAPSDGAFRARSGKGYVAPKDGRRRSSSPRAVLPMRHATLRGYTHRRP